MNMKNITKVALPLLKPFSVIRMKMQTNMPGGDWGGAVITVNTNSEEAAVRAADIFDDKGALMWMNLLRNMVTR